MMGNDMNEGSSTSGARSCGQGPALPLSRKPIRPEGRRPALEGQGKNYRYVPLTPELLTLAVALERDPLTAVMTEGSAFAARVLLPGLAYAMLDGGELVGCGGLTPLWHGRAEAWLLVSRLAGRRQIAAGIRHAAQWFAARQRDPAFRRIEMYVRRSAPWRATFAAALGMSLEGALSVWAPDGEDYCLYARIQPQGNH